MSDADINVKFSVPGLAKAERGLDNMAKDADKLKRKEKELAATTKKTSADFVAQEKVKEAATKKRLMQAEKERLLEIANAKTKKQQFFSSASKIGGASGSALAGVGEGVGVGGAIGALAGVAALGAVVVQGITALETRTADEIIASNKLSDELRQLTQSYKESRNQELRGILGADFGVKRQLQAEIGNIGAVENLASSDSSAYSSVLKASKSGILDAVGGQQRLLQLFQGAKDFGLSSSDVIGNLQGESLEQLKARRKSGTLDFRAVGANNFKEFMRMNRNIQGYYDTASQGNAADRNTLTDKRNSDLLAASGTVSNADIREKIARDANPASAAMLEIQKKQLDILGALTTRMETQGYFSQFLDEINPFGAGSFAEQVAKQAAVLSDTMSAK